MRHYFESRLFLSNLVFFSLSLNGDLMFGGCTQRAKQSSNYPNRIGFKIIFLIKKNNLNIFFEKDERAGFVGDHCNL